MIYMREQNIAIIQYKLVDGAYRVMTERRLMGITAGSLFPGLDGACEELKEKLFSV